MTQPGALPRPDTGNRPVRNQLAASGKSQTLLFTKILRERFNVSDRAASI
jgi:hypothetical protein